MTLDFSAFALATLAALCLASSSPAQDAESPERLDPNMATVSPDGNTLWYDALLLGVEGQGWTDVAAPYDRLPARAEGVVRDPVWSLSRDSAGLAVRFVTDARTISGRWTLTSPGLDMPHMPATGMSGLDLYVRMEDGGWRWAGAGRPSEQTNEKQLVSGLPEGEREFLLYLPLYNGTQSLEIGLPPGATLSEAPARPEGRDRPIVVWGTSITQGGCASRPGMAYTAILGRWLERPVINLGFSGNGQMEPEMAALLAELDPAAYVLDCLPNCSGGMVAERTEPVVDAFRAAHPDVPIVLVESIEYQQAPVVPGWRDTYNELNQALRAAYDRMLARGVTGLHYVEGKPLLGDDGEATVDGVHPTDLGFLRMAEVLAPVLREAIEGR